MATARVLVVGGYQAGKTTTCFDLLEECGNKVCRPSTYTPTKGVQLHHLVDGRQVVKLLDCAGHPDYMGFTELYYERADAVVVVGPAEDWAEKVRDVAGHIPMVHIPHAGSDVGQIVNLWRE